MLNIKPEELKASILQYAIEGRLVEQRAEEGTAEELYRQIQSEKNKLIKDGKIKKEKPLPNITEDEIPFDIPESWKWCHLSEVLDVRDGTHDSPKYVHEGIPLVTSKNLSNGNIDFENIKYITQADADKINERSAVNDNDILFAMIGSIGNPVLVKKDREFCIKNMALFKRYANTNIDMNYMYWFFYFAQYSLKAEASGGVQSFVSLSRLREYSFPLPPFAEQHRIVGKIEELLPYVDRYAEAYGKLEEFNAKFPEEMKKSILQYAIQGKLVEQRAEEGTAEELYNQIQAEKQKLIKEGKIKKEKPLPEIDEDEIPFDIPESWKWVRVQDIAILNSGNQYEETSKGIPYIKVADMNLPENQQYIRTSSRFADESNDGCILPNSIIFPKRGGAIATNKKRIVKDTKVFIDSNTMGMTIILPAVFDYVKVWFDGVDLGNLQSGSSIPQINNKDIYPLMIPLPPLAEQRRIVAKIEELLPLCERLAEQ